MTCSSPVKEDTDEIDIVSGTVVTKVQMHVARCTAVSCYAALFLLNHKVVLLSLR